MSNFLKDVSSVGLSKIVIIIFGVGTSVIVARYLGPEGTGTLTALMVYPTIFMSFGSLGIRQSVTYFTGKKIYTEDQILSAVSFIWMLTSVASLIICFFLIRYFSNSGYNLLWVILAISPIPFKLFITYLSGFYLGKNEISKFNSIGWVPAMFVFISSIICIIILGYGISGAILSYILGPLVLFLIFFLRLYKKSNGGFQAEFKVLKSLLSLGLVYALALVINVLNYSFDSILLDKLSTPYELGIYSRGSGMSQYLWQIPLILGTIIFARSSTSKNGDAYSKKVVQLMRLSLIIVLVASLGLFLLAPFIINLLYGKEFFDSILILRILLPGVFLLTAFKVMNMDLAGKGKPWVAVKAMLPALILNIILNILWIPEYGSVGASVASTISYSFATILFIYFYSKETKLSLREILVFKKEDFTPIINIIAKLKNR